MTKQRIGLKPRDYYSYIRSDAWKSVKERYRNSRLCKVCFCCGADGPDVEFNLHHATYKRLGCERLTDLRRVCRECHKEIHERAERKGMNLWAATKAQRSYMVRWQKPKKRKKNRGRT